MLSSRHHVHGLLKKVVWCFWYGFTDSCLPLEHIIASQRTSCLKPALWFGCLLWEESVLLFLGLCWGWAVSQQFLSFPCCVYIFSWIAEQQAVWLVTLPPVQDSSSVPSGHVADMICHRWAPELLYFQPVWWETGLTGCCDPGSAPMGANKFLLSYHWSTLLLLLHFSSFKWRLSLQVFSECWSWWRLEGQNIIWIKRSQTVQHFSLLCFQMYFQWTAPHHNTWRVLRFYYLQITETVL